VTSTTPRIAEDGEPRAEGDEEPRAEGREEAGAEGCDGHLRTHLEPVAPPATLPAFAAPAAGSLQPQRAVPDHRRARRLAFLRRLSRKAAHAARTQPSARHHHRAGTSRWVGALVRLNADLRSDSAAARRCPWQQRVPPHHPPAASASLSHATPPPMHTSNATSDPAVTGNIRGDGASASTDHHNSSDKRHGFCPVQVSGPLQPRWSHASGEGMAFWRGAAVCLRAHGAFRGAPEVCRLRGAAIARRRRLCRSLSHPRPGHRV